MDQERVKAAWEVIYKHSDKRPSQLTDDEMEQLKEVGGYLVKHDPRYKEMLGVLRSIALSPEPSGEKSTQVVKDYCERALWIDDLHEWATSK